MVPHRPVLHTKDRCWQQTAPRLGRGKALPLCYAGAPAEVLFSSPRPKNSAITVKPSALLFSCVKNLSCRTACANGEATLYSAFTRDGGTQMGSEHTWHQAM